MAPGLREPEPLFRILRSILPRPESYSCSDFHSVLTLLSLLCNARRWSSPQASWATVPLMAKLFVLPCRLLALFRSNSLSFCHVWSNTIIVCASFLKCTRNTTYSRRNHRCLLKLMYVQLLPFPFLLLRPSSHFPFNWKCTVWSGPNRPIRGPQELLPG